MTKGFVTDRVGAVLYWRSIKVRQVRAPSCLTTPARRSPRQQEFRQHFPQPGWVERDAGDLGDAARGHDEGVHAVLVQRPQDVAAIGITNQRETTVLWDRATGRRSPTRSSGRTAAPPTSATA